MKDDAIIEALEAAQIALEKIPVTALDGVYADTNEVARCVRRGLQAARLENQSNSNVLKSLGELLRICYRTCSEKDEVMLPGGRTTSDVIVDATIAMIVGMGSQSRGNRPAKAGPYQRRRRERLKTRTDLQVNRKAI